MKRWTEAEMIALARSGVNKVDQLGPRGATLVNSEEVTAMAAVIALSGALPPSDQTTNTRKRKQP